MKQRAQNGLIWLLALSLFISVSASAIALASRIRYYTIVEDVNSMIPLVPESVTVEDLRAAAQAAASKPTHTPALLIWEDSTVYAVPLSCEPPVTRSAVPAVQAVRLNQTSDFTVSDDRTVWGTNTQVDIFRTSYENGSHNITVASGRGDKVIAPGTENAYTFKLKNSHSVPMDYTVTVNAWFTPGDVSIPVTCRLSRYDGHWVAGDETAWLDVSGFDGVQDEAVLSPNSYVTYTLDWQWPYEGDDALDTALAQRADSEDLSMTIEIVTSATAVFDDEPDDPDDPVDPPKPPVDPDDPVDPPKPPVDPDDPVDPPKPPVDPDDPDDPDKPPVDPDDPDDPDKPHVGEDLPPKTGDDTSPILWIVLAACSFLLLMLLVFWQDDEKKTTRPKGD